MYKTFLRFALAVKPVLQRISVRTSPDTDVRKFPCGNFLPLKVKNPRYTPPDLLSFNIFKVRGLRAGICKANSIKRKGTPTACLFRAQRARSPAAFCLRQNRQDRHSAERRVKNPHKSPALPDFYTSARAAAARPRPLCGREGVIAPGFSGTGGVSKGDSVPLRT